MRFSLPDWIKFRGEGHGKQQARVLCRMAELVPSVPLVVVAEVVLEGPRNGDQRELPQVGQFSRILAMKDKAGEHPANGLHVLRQVQVNLVVDLAEVGPRRLLVEPIHGQPTRREVRGDARPCGECEDGDGDDPMK